MSKFADTKPSVLRKKGESQDGSNKETNQAELYKKWTFHACVSGRGNEIFVFSEKLACFVFVLPPFGDPPFRGIMEDISWLFIWMKRDIIIVVCMG